MLAAHAIDLVKKAQIEQPPPLDDSIVGDFSSAAREGSQPTKIMKVLTGLMEGVTILKRPASIERGRDASLQARAHVVLCLAKAEIEAICNLDADHLNRFLWIHQGESREYEAGDVSKSRMFFKAYQRTVEEIVSLRRDGKALMVPIESEAALNEFEDALRRYEDEITRRSVDAGPWARGLPQTPFWALSLLRRSLADHCRLDDQSLIEASFSVSRRLVEKHRDNVLLITRVKLLADRQNLAGRMIEKVSEATSPVKFRDLARCNHNQRKEIVAPLVDALIDVGVLVRDEDGKYALGTVDLAEAVESLNQKFTRS